MSLTLLSLPLSAPVQAFKACVTYLLNPVVFYGAHGTDRLSEIPPHLRDLLVADIENRQMREEIKQAAVLRAEADSLRLENQRLRAALGLKAPWGRQPLWAHVIERDPLHWYHGVIIDAGQDAGVALNAPVLAPQGEGLAVLGRVIEVRPRSSVVLLVSDELSSVAAYLSSSTLEGLVQGQGTSRLLMNYLSSDVNLDKGELVYTSPTSATFPPDVLIGKVSRVFPRDPFLTFQSVEVAPAVDAGALKEVVILRRTGAAPIVAVRPRPAAPSPDEVQDSDEVPGDPIDGEEGAQ